LARRLLRCLALCVAVTLGLTITPLFGAADTVGVLPFFNQSNAANMDWMGESVAETLRESLAAAGVLALPRAERVEVYKRLSVRSGPVLTRATILRIGQTMDAAQIVFGSFEVVPPPAGDSASRGQLKITANLIDAKRLKTGPQFFETGALEDLSLLESRMAWQCLHYFQPHSTPPEDAYLHDRPPVRIDAVESYIRGLLTDSPDQKQKLFLQASHLDPRYSDPAFQLGRMAFDKKDYQTAQTWLEKIASTYSHYHEAEFLLALCRYYAGNFDGAIGILEALSTEVPLNEVFNDLGAAQSRKNQPASIESFKKALDGGETDPDYWFNLGFAQWKNGRPADAAQSLKASLERDPDDDEAKALLARCQRGELPHPGENLNLERIKKTFEETVFLQLQAELKK
jgi:tetratricopeptide (TPR) repeat protein